MTGVDGRPEVIMEGSMDGEEWRVLKSSKLVNNIIRTSLLSGL